MASGLVDPWSALDRRVEGAQGQISPSAEEVRMSAYVVADETINKVVTFLDGNDRNLSWLKAPFLEIGYQPETREGRQALAEALLAMNRDAVSGMRMGKRIGRSRLSGGRFVSTRSPCRRRPGACVTNAPRATSIPRRCTRHWISSRIGWLRTSWVACRNSRARPGVELPPLCVFPDVGKGTGEGRSAQGGGMAKKRKVCVFCGRKCDGSISVDQGRHVFCSGVHKTKWLSLGTSPGPAGLRAILPKF